MKRDTMKTMEAIRNSMLTKLDHVKDTANNAEQDVMQVMKDFVYSLNKEQRRKDRIRKVQYIAIGVGATTAIIGLAGFLLKRKNIEQTIGQVGQNIEDSGRYLKYKTEETAAHISDKTEQAVDSLKENAADTAETISNKTEHAINTLKEKTVQNPN